MWKKLALLIPVLLILDSCDKNSGNDTDTPTNISIGMATGSTNRLEGTYRYRGKPASHARLDTVSRPARLNSMLPSNTLAYLRIPNVWGFLASPKGNALSNALKDNQHVTLVKNLREALFKTLQPQKIGKKKLSSLFFYHLRAPVEIAVLAPLNNKPADPLLLIHTRVNFKSTAVLNQYLNELSQEVPGLKLAQPVAATSPGEIHYQKLRYKLYYDAATRDVTLVGSRSIDTVDANRLKAGLQKHKHPMSAMEQKIDASGKGLFVYLDLDATYSALGNTVPEIGMMRMSLVFAKQVAAGWGVANGKSRIKMIARMPWDFHAYTSVMGKDLPLTSAGIPDIIAVLAIPGPGHWRSLRAMLTASPQGKSFTSLLAQTQQALGVSVEQVLESVGPNLVLLYDKTGEYLALQIRDKKKFRLMLDKLIAARKLHYKKTKQAGITIHYLKVPISADNDIAKDAPFPLNLHFAQKMHFYWAEEGDYIVLANVPQMLTDRARFPNKLTLGDWLKQSQRQDTENTALLLSTTINGSARASYYYYLQILQVLGDTFSYPVDLTKLPSAAELNFPVQGTYGFQLDLMRDGLSVELTFENNPLEFIVASRSLLAIAVVTVTAAIAIPAYTEHAKRVKISAAVNAANSYKTAVSQYYQANKKFPDAAAASKITSSPRHRHASYRIRIEPGTGKIIATIRGSGKITLVPTAGGNTLTWSCVTTIQYRLVPSQCRRYGQ